MPKNKKLAIFEGRKTRRLWDEEKELWYFSVADVIAVLTNSIDSLAYWRKLKERLLKEGGNETVTKCHALKMVATDGKMRLTDVADTEVMFRLIQSIPSPKAEPFKLWLARVGYERIEKTKDPEKAIRRALATYLKKGYSKNLDFLIYEIRKLINPAKFDLGKIIFCSLLYISRRLLGFRRWDSVPALFGYFQARGRIGPN